MTPTLRTAILDALMERWRTVQHKNVDQTWLKQHKEPEARQYFSSCLDTILPVAEPMIRADECTAAEIRGLEMAKEIIARRAEDTGHMISAAEVVEHILARIAELKAKTEPTK